MRRAAVKQCAHFLRARRIHQFVVIASQIVVTILRLSITNQHCKKFTTHAAHLQWIFSAIAK
jgi:hypothetical protein